MSRVSSGASVNFLLIACGSLLAGPRTQCAEVRISVNKAVCSLSPALEANSILCEVLFCRQEAVFWDAVAAGLRPESLCMLGPTGRCSCSCISFGNVKDIVALGQPSNSLPAGTRGGPRTFVANGRKEVVVGAAAAAAAVVVVAVVVEQQ